MLSAVVKHSFHCDECHSTGVCNHKIIICGFWKSICRVSIQEHL